MGSAVPRRSLLPTRAPPQHAGTTAQTTRARCLLSTGLVQSAHDVLMWEDRKQAGPARGRAMVAPDVQASYAELRKLALFDGIPNDELYGAIAEGGIERVVLARDVIVADAGRV